MTEKSRRLSWDGCANARDLGGFSLASSGATRTGGLIRSDNLARLTADGEDAVRAGGVSAIIDVRSPYELDLEAGAAAWREGKPLPNPRNHLGGVVLGGKIYAVAGQHDHDNRLTTQADVHAYDPGIDSWRQVASLPIPLSHIANSSFALDGRLVVVGGEVDHFEAVPNVFAYDPGEDVWLELTSLPLARVSTVADVVNGTIISAGGSGSRRGADTFVGTFAQ